MLSLDEAIAHAREVAEKKRAEYDFECSYYGKETVDNGEKLDCVKCAEEHEQLAEWLEELKELRNMTAGHLYAVAFNRGYLKAEKEAIEKDGMLLFKVICDVDCYGNKEFQKEVLLTEDDYAEAKSKGYYLA